jgi:hypothetical protein
MATTAMTTTTTTSPSSSPTLTMTSLPRSPKALPQMTAPAPTPMLTLRRIFMMRTVTPPTSKTDSAGNLVIVAAGTIAGDNGAVAAAMDEDEDLTHLDPIAHRTCKS